MSDIIDGVGQILTAATGVPYAGQEPQNRDRIPSRGVYVLERIGGRMFPLGVADDPWVQVTALAESKKGAFDLLREAREALAGPHDYVGGFFVYSTEEVLAPEEAPMPSDPFYRVRCTFRFRVKGLA